MWAIFVAYLFRTSRDGTRAVTLLLVITTGKKPKPAGQQTKLAQIPRRGFRSTARHMQRGSGRDPHAASEGTAGTALWARKVSSFFAKRQS